MGCVDSVATKENNRKSILVTGFGPFHDVRENPSGRIAKRLNGRVVGTCVVDGLQLDVSYRTAAPMIVQRVEQISPVAVLMLGVARHQKGLRLEWVARNRVESRRADAEGVVPSEPLNGEQQLSHKLQTVARVDRLVELLSAEQIACFESWDAGGYVCNASYYGVLTAANVPTLFCHIPNVSPELMDALECDVIALVRTWLEQLGSGFKTLS